VSAGERVANLVRADESRTTQDQQAHRIQGKTFT
jgi:hypothetical protein